MEKEQPRPSPSPSSPRVQASIQNVIKLFQLGQITDDTCNELISSLLEGQPELEGRAVEPPKLKRLKKLSDSRLPEPSTAPIFKNLPAVKKTKDDEGSLFEEPYAPSRLQPADSSSQGTPISVFGR
jgi:hypothetical protein